MPSVSPDWTVANPPTSAPAAMDTLMAQQAQDTTQINAQTSKSRGFLRNDYTQYQLPQLQSQIASVGQNYSSANTKAQGKSYQDFLHSDDDIISAANRQLDDLTRQRVYASIGLVI